jgi:hypothetical protein
MAAILKKQYELLDLKVSLDTSSEPSAKVVLRLEWSQFDKTEEWGRWQVDPIDLGLSDELGMGKDQSLEKNFRFPEQTGGLLKKAIDSLPEAFTRWADEPVLWLHLEKPYGMLGVVPWERLLLPFVEPRPIVRLPDFIVLPPRETPGTLDVVLCGSSPVAKGWIGLGDYLVRFAERIRDAVLPRRATIHVFTDQRLHDQLKARGLPGEGRGQEAYFRLYDPSRAQALPAPGADPDAVEGEDRLDNPWLRWILLEMSGRSADVVHFISHGYLSLERPALAMAESPTRNFDTSIARFIGPSQLNRFLTQTGAWSLACTSPPRDYSPMGLRLLTDTIAQRRPGSFLYHELRHVEPDLMVLEAAYAFLFGGLFGVSPPPRAPGVFVYCQPFQLRPTGFGALKTFARDRGGLLHLETEQFRSARALEMAMEDAVGDEAPFRSVFVEEESNVPHWIATTERYLEQCRWQLMRWEQEDQSGKLAETRREEIEGLREAVALIERTASETVLHHHQGPSNGTGGGAPGPSGEVPPPTSSGPQDFVPAKAEGSNADPAPPLTPEPPEPPPGPMPKSGDLLYILYNCKSKCLKLLRSSASKLKQAVSSTIGKIHIRSTELYNQISRKIWPFQTARGARTHRFLGSGPPPPHDDQRGSDTDRPPGGDVKGPGGGNRPEGPPMTAEGAS